MKFMKSLTAMLLALALGAGLALPATAKDKDAAPVKFLVLGDSIAGGGNMLIEELRYARIVARAKGYDLTNLAAGGTQSDKLLRQLKEEKTFRQAVREADIIAVSIGGNDLLHAEDMGALVVEAMLGDYRQIDPILAFFKKNFDGIIAQLLKLNPDARLIVQTLYNPAFPLPSLDKGYDYAISGINAGIRANHAKQPGAYEIADVYAAFKDRSGLVFIDMTHPGMAGHAMIAAVLLDTLNGTDTRKPLAYLGVPDLLIRASKPALQLTDAVLVQGLLKALRPVLF